MRAPTGGFSALENSFFEEGDTLSTKEFAAVDFSDLDTGHAQPSLWIQACDALARMIRSFK